MTQFYKYDFSNVFKEIFSRDFWVVTSWYQSLGLRDSGALPSVSELKLRKWYRVFKRKTIVTKGFWEKKTILEKYKEKSFRKSKKSFEKRKGCGACNQPSSSKYSQFTHTSYIMIISIGFSFSFSSSFSRTAC